MDANPPRDLIQRLDQLPDPRAHNVVHPLTNVVVIAILGICSGCEDWDEVEIFGNSYVDLLGLFMDLSTGIPSHDTFERVFRALDPDAFEQFFQGYVTTLSSAGKAKGLKPGLQSLAIDGKTLRSSFKDANRSTAVHMVSAWSHEQGMVLGQIATDVKSNEITAIPRLLEMLDLTRRVVSIDAMGCQRDIAKQIVGQGGYYLLQIKGNQEKLLELTQRGFTGGLPILSRASTPIEVGHGRTELRRLDTVSAVEAGVDPNDWSDAKTLIRQRGVRGIGQEVSGHDRYYLTNLPHDDAEDLLKRCRNHWGVENKLHWVLDVVLKEDGSRIREDHGAENMARLRRLAINLINAAPPPHGKKMSQKMKRKAAGWDLNYLLNIMFGVA